MLDGRMITLDICVLHLTARSFRFTNRKCMHIYEFGIHCKLTKAPNIGGGEK